MALGSFKEELARSHSSYTRSIEIFLENSTHLPLDASVELKQAELRSDSLNLIKKFLELAYEYCEANDLESGSDEALAAFEEAHATATSIIYSYQGLPNRAEEQRALSPKQVTDALALVVPSNVTSIVAHVKENGDLGANSDGLSRAVGEYVKGRFKSAIVDQVLLKALTQVEITAFLDTMLTKDPLTGKNKLEAAQPFSALRVVWTVIKLAIVLWTTCFFIAISPLALSMLSFDTMLLVGLGIALVGTVALMIILVYGLYITTKASPLMKKRENNIINLIEIVNGFFHEFKSLGPFSTARFRKRVDDVAEAGVVWPSALYVLLDDMESRRVRSF